MNKIRVLFVCLGNICRSPMAEAIFYEDVEKSNLMGKIEVDSAGTSGWHNNKPPHEGTMKVLTANNIRYKEMKSRKFIKEDGRTFDYIVVMDEQNKQDVLEILDGTGHAKVIKLLDFAKEVKDKDVPDPYYTGDFDYTYKLITLSSTYLLEHIKEEHNI